MKFSLKERQIAFGLCCGMNDKQMGQALRLPASVIAYRVRLLCKKTGMADRVEFAITQNASVRELLYGEHEEPVKAGTPATASQSKPGRTYLWVDNK